jgi:hypothetical protein
MGGRVGQAEQGRNEKVMDTLMYYAVAVIFGGVGLLFLVYPFLEDFKIGTFLIYEAVAGFFGALSTAMFVHNGTLGEILLAVLIGGLSLVCGLSNIVSVFTHNIRVDAVLMDKQRVRKRKSSYYTLTFRLTDRQATYTATHVSFAGKYKPGDIYHIYIGRKGTTAYVQRPIWFLEGFLMAMFGVLFLGTIPYVLI